MKGWKDILHAKGKQKKAGGAILIPDKIDLKIKNIHVIRNQGINPRGRHKNCKYLCTQIGVPQYIRQTPADIKGEMDSKT